MKIYKITHFVITSISKLFSFTAWLLAITIQMPNHRILNKHISQSLYLHASQIQYTHIMIEHVSKYECEY